MPKSARIFADFFIRQAGGLAVYFKAGFVVRTGFEPVLEFTYLININVPVFNLIYLPLFGIAFTNFAT